MRHVLVAAAAAFLAGTAPMAHAQTFEIVPLFDFENLPGDGPATGDTEQFLIIPLPGNGEDEYAALPEDTPETGLARELDEGEIRAYLEAVDVDSVQDMEREGNFFLVKATREGQDIELRVDAFTGDIIELL